MSLHLIVDIERKSTRKTLSQFRLSRPTKHSFREFLMDSFLDAAIAEAEAGLAEGGIPIGSVLVHRGTIIGRGHNRRVQRGSAVLHGEMDALENAGRLPASVYSESVLYTTLSPCAMCSGAILLYRIPRVIVGENQTFMGEEELLRRPGRERGSRQSERAASAHETIHRRSPEHSGTRISVCSAMIVVALSLSSNLDAPSSNERSSRSSSGRRRQASRVTTSPFRETPSRRLPGHWHQQRPRPALLVPAGFHVTVFAAEPDVRNPIAMAWDPGAGSGSPRTTRMPSGPRSSTWPSATGS